MNTYEQNLKILKDLLEKNPIHYMNVLTAKRYESTYNEVLKFINESVPDCIKDPKYNLKTKIYWLINGITSWDNPLVKCRICGRPIDYRNVININAGYTVKKEYPICENCRYKDKESFRKISETQKNKTNEEKRKSYEKRKQAYLKHYGVDHNFKDESCKEKSRQTCMKKYGTKYSCQNASVKEKIRNTCIERYGADNIFKSEYGKQKIKETMIKRYGYDHPLKVPKIQEVLREKCHVHNLEYSWINCIINDPYSEPMFSKEYYLQNYSGSFKFTFKCRKCGNIYESIHIDGEHSRCKKCFPGNASIPEREISEFIAGLNIQNITILENNRKAIEPYELDIYIPERKLAIEFNGLYWHSIKNPKDPIGKNMHVKKTELCKAKGIQLIHVFEDEWRLQKAIVMSRLKNLLGIYDCKIYARQCIVKTVDSNVSRQFQDENHIQRSVNASVNLGLYYNDELVSLMTFGKTRFSKEYEWELLRFCNKIGYHIPGAASKLLTYFERNYSPKSIISYADRRWSKGNVYEKIGFKLDHISNLNYWYCRHDMKMIRESRVKYQKHKLPKLLKKFDPTKTEQQNMMDNEYMIVYDCGNLVYVKKYYQ